jgi:acyl-CoA dehydrogenase
LGRRGPSDRLMRTCAEILLNPSATRDRLTVDIFHGLGDEGLARLERAFALTVAAQPLRDRLHKAHIRDVEKARLEGLINDAEAGELRAAAAAVAAAIAVDDFAPEAISPRQAAADVVPVKWNPFKRQTRSRRSSLAGGW